VMNASGVRRVATLQKIVLPLRALLGPLTAD
jgi:hypothetical protein